MALPAVLKDPVRGYRLPTGYLSQEVTTNLGFRGFEVREGFDRQALAGVLSELGEDRCAHSWLRFAPREGESARPDELQSWEHEQRPTLWFNYYGIRADGGRDLVGAGCIGERIAWSFPHQGFPVVARGFVCRPYRRRGVYRALLLHRVSYCKRHWGKGLRAIHLGTAIPSVLRTVTDCEVVDPPFRAVGREFVDGNLVVDLLAFESAYAASLVACLEGESKRGSGAVLEPVRVELEALLSGRQGANLHRLRGRVHELPGCYAERVQELTPLIGLCDYFDVPSQDDIIVPREQG